MNNVTYRATNLVGGTNPIEFDITPVAPLWISEVLVYLNSSYPPPAAFGKIHAGSAAHPSHLTIFVDQALFNQLCSCLGGSAVDISIDYDDTLTVTNIFGVEEPLRAQLLVLGKKVDDIATIIHGVKMELEERRHHGSDITELAKKKTG